MNKISPRYFIPIRVVGYIEVFAEADPIVHVDRYDWDWGTYPRVGPYGEDTEVVIVHVGDNDPQITVEVDANVVEAVRSKVHIDFETQWKITRTAEEEILGL
jgi:hypothetical protein